MQMMREHRMAGLVARGFLPVSGDVKTSFGIFHNPADGIPLPYCHLTKDGKLVYSEADPRTKPRGKRTPKKERNPMNGITPEMLATMVAQAVATAMAQNGGNGAVANIGPKAVAQPKRPDGRAKSEQRRQQPNRMAGRPQAHQCPPTQAHPQAQDQEAVVQHG